MLAYRSGLFPMADARDDPEVFWVEPKRRAILPLDGFHCSRSLARALRRGRFTVTCNAAFAAVIDACAAPRAGELGGGELGGGESGETWISHRIAATYRLLHELGCAHSIECWQAGELVGGLYGVGFDRVFCGESMFSRVTDASKVALAWLVAALRQGGGELLDCQFMTGHLGSLGAIEISQAEYLRRLVQAQRDSCGDQWSVESTGGGGAASAGGVAAGASAAGLPDGFAALLRAAKSAGLSSSPGNFIAQSLTQTS